MLRIDRFSTRKESRSFVETIGHILSSLLTKEINSSRVLRGDQFSTGEADVLYDGAEENGTSYVSGRRGNLAVSTCAQEQIHQQMPHPLRFRNSSAHLKCPVGQAVNDVSSLRMCPSWCIPER